MNINGFSQPIPKDFNFIGIQENWKYLAKDTNFIKSPKDNRSTPYSGRIPHMIETFDNDLLILESVRGQTPWRGIEGCLLHNININSGKVNWIYHNNSYVGNTHRESYVYSQILKNIDGNYEIIGLRDLKPLDTTRSFLGFYGTPIQRLINGKDGGIISANYSDDTTKFEQNFFGNGNIFIENKKEKVRRVAFSWVVQDNVLYIKVEFCMIDDKLKINLPCADSVLYNTEISTTGQVSFYKPQLLRLSSDTMLILFGTNNHKEGESTISKMELFYVDHSEGVKVVNKVDVTNDIYHPQGGWDSDIFIWTIDNNVFLAQQIDYISDSSFIWLNWYDKNGNLINKIDKLKYGDVTYRNFYFLGVKDGVLYIAAVRNDNETEGFDILKIFPGQGIIEKCGNLARKKEELMEYSISCSKFLPDNKIMIGFWANEKIEGKDYNYQYYYCFNTADLGITTNNIEIDNKSIPIHIYPNPASTSISINCEDSDASMIEIIDRLGRVVYRDKSRECEELSIDISGYTPGLYFVRLIDDSGKVTGRGKFVKE